MLLWLPQEGVYGYRLNVWWYLVASGSVEYHVSQRAMNISSNYSGQVLLLLCNSGDG